MIVGTPPVPDGLDKIIKFLDLGIRATSDSTVNFYSLPKEAFALSKQKKI